MKHIVFECEKDKALGPDGFIMTLFQDCWEVGFLNVFVEFFQSGVVNAITNATFICPISKKGKSMRIKNFRYNIGGKCHH